MTHTRWDELERGRTIKRHLKKRTMKNEEKKREKRGDRKNVSAEKYN